MQKVIDSFSLWSRAVLLTSSGFQSVPEIRCPALCRVGTSTFWLLIMISYNSITQGHWISLWHKQFWLLRGNMLPALPVSFSKSLQEALCQKVSISLSLLHQPQSGLSGSGHCITSTLVVYKSPSDKRNDFVNNQGSQRCKLPLCVDSSAKKALCYLPDCPHHSGLMIRPCVLDPSLFGAVCSWSIKWLINDTIIKVMLKDSSYKVIYTSVGVSHQRYQGWPRNVTIKAKSASFDSIKCLLWQTDLAWISLITRWKSSWILHWPMRWGRLNAWWDELNVPIENDFHSVCDA